jgi:hypothetical protein
MSSQTISRAPADWRLCAEKILIHALTSKIDYMYGEFVNRDDSSFETMSELIAEYGNKLFQAYSNNSEVLSSYYMKLKKNGEENDDDDEYHDATLELKFCIPIVEAMHGDNSDEIYEMIEPYNIQQVEFEEENRDIRNKVLYTVRSHSE